MYIDIPGCRLLPITVHGKAGLCTTATSTSLLSAAHYQRMSSAMLPMPAYLTYANCQFIGDMFKDMHTRLLAFI